LCGATRHAPRTTFTIAIAITHPSPARAFFKFIRRIVMTSHFGNIKQIHHVAYRCKDAKETVLWYERMLGMRFQLAFSEDHVPSTGELDPYMHVFLDAGGGNVLAFFELPDQPPMGRDLNTPEWVQHIAFEVADRPELERQKAHLEAQGLDVIGITNHGVFHSIYFFDPNGHRLELTHRDADEAALHQQLDAVKWAMLNEWALTKRAPKGGLNHAAFLSAHAGTGTGTDTGMDLNLNLANADGA
jgi:catechol 2,3-dioxygenase-like lactoylglutathione lyase family enzyme